MALVQKKGVVGFGLRDLYVALARVEVIGQQDVAHAVAHVLLVFFLGGPRLGRNRGEHLVEQLAGPLIESEAHHARFGGLGIQVEHVLPIG